MIHLQLQQLPIGWREGVGEDLEKKKSYQIFVTIRYVLGLVRWLSG